MDEEQTTRIISLTGAIQKLSVKHRAVIALVIDGYKRYEIGVILGLTHGAIKFIYDQAVIQIMEELRSA